MRVRLSPVGPERKHDDAAAELRESPILAIENLPKLAYCADMLFIRTGTAGMLLLACTPPPAAETGTSGGVEGGPGGTEDTAAVTSTEAPTLSTGAMATTLESATEATTLTTDALTTTTEPLPEYPDCGYSVVPLLEIDDESVRPIAGDIDGDGDADIMAIGHTNVQPGGDTLTLWRAEGKTYVLEDSRELSWSNKHFLAEVDGEPGLELIVTSVIDIDPGNEFEFRAEVYRWPDCAGPGFPAPVVTIHDAGSDSVRVADLDGDGRADLYTLSGYPATVGIWLGAGDGSFIHAQTIETFGCYVNDVIVVDLDHDGSSDLVTVGDCNTSITDPPLVLHRGGVDGFGPPEVIGNVSGITFYLRAGRFNADPWDDVLYFSEYGESIAIAEADGDGALSLPWIYPLANPGGQVIDLDQDGLSDILRGTSRLRGTGSWFEGCSFSPVAVSAIDLDGSPPLELLARDGSAVFALVGP